MSDRKCTCVLHRPQEGGSMVHTPCRGKATHRLKDPDGVAYLCRQHARALKDMYEPGQLRKLVSTSASPDDR